MGQARKRRLVPAVLGAAAQAPGAEPAAEPAAEAAAEPAAAPELEWKPLPAVLVDVIKEHNRTIETALEFYFKGAGYDTSKLNVDVGAMVFTVRS